MFDRAADTSSAATRRIDFEAEFERLAAIRDGWDRTHLINAARHSCDVFLTRDKELYLKRRGEIQSVIGHMRIEHPEEFLSSLGDA